MASFRMERMRSVMWYLQIAEMTEALKNNPNDVQGLFDRGELSLEEGNLEGAVQDFLQALKNNPAFVDLQIVDRWDGMPPLVIGNGGNVMMPLQDLERRSQSNTNANSPSQSTIR